MSFIPIMPLSYYMDNNEYESLEILNQHNILIKAKIEHIQPESNQLDDMFSELDDLLDFDSLFPEFS